MIALFPVREKDKLKLIRGICPETDQRKLSGKRNAANIVNGENNPSPQRDYLLLQGGCPCHADGENSALGKKECVQTVKNMRVRDGAQRPSCGVGASGVAIAVQRT